MAPNILTLSLFALVAPVVIARLSFEKIEKRAVPSYVTAYAPLVYLHSQETYFPSDISAHLSNTQPEVNFAVVSGAPNPLTVNNLDQLNNLGGSNVYLTSKTDITTNPAYLNGVKPNANGVTTGAKSCAVVVNDHGNNVVDAFYFYFYSFNWGGIVLGENLGNHVGDWEHNMIRFKNGAPSQVWFSQHTDGEAFTYSALQKSGIRPVAYSGNGSHAVYAIAGNHEHTIPGFNLPINGLITDHTDAGTLWDPVASAYFYSWSNSTQAFTALDSSSPVPYLNFVGKWGDQQYPDSDKRQFNFLGIEHRYDSGPTGPRDKNLQRTNVCLDGDDCIVRPILTARSEQ